MPACNTRLPLGNNVDRTKTAEDEQPQQLPVSIVDDSLQVLTAEDPPDGGYGWVCLGALFTINCFTWGVIAVS